jgi:DNA-directed RNA polymerase specialized sigma24 family protein
MFRRIPPLQLRRFEQVEPEIRIALQRALTARAATREREPLGLMGLQALHGSLFPGSETELWTFVRYVAPLIRTMEMQTAERQAMIEPVKLRLIDLEQWLRRLEELDPECVRIIELRYYAGLSIRQAALVLGLPVSHALTQLRFARAWLQARVRWSLDASR